MAVRVMQDQGFEIEALNIRTVFECCKTKAAQTAAELGVRLTVLSVADDYVELIRHPEFGYGKGANPCIDCRIYMCKMAKEFMQQVEACVVVTGEVLGQRPMSQRRWQADTIERKSSLPGRLLRPLSAKLLPPTIPETEGLIDREKLYDFNGRSRKGLIALARQLGLKEIPQPSNGCPLTQTSFAPRVYDLMRHSLQATRWDFELLNVGRHIRKDDQTKIVMGRNAEENALLAQLFQQCGNAEPAYLHPESFLGPDVMVVGRVTDEAIRLAGALVLRFTRRFDPDDAQVRLTHAGSWRIIRAAMSDAAARLSPI